MPKCLLLAVCSLFLTSCGLEDETKKPFFPYNQQSTPFYLLPETSTALQSLRVPCRRHYLLNFVEDYGQCDMSL